MPGKIKLLNRKSLNVLVALLFGLGLVSSTFQGEANASTADPTPNYMNNTSQNSLVSDGKTLVWEGYSPDDTAHKNLNIYGQDIASGRQFAIADTANTEYSPEIDGDYVIWAEKEDAVTLNLMGGNLSSGKKFLIASSTVGGIWSWSVSGGTAAWVVLAGDIGENIYTRNLQTLADPVLVLGRDQIGDGSAYGYISLNAKYLTLMTVNSSGNTCILYSYVIGDPKAQLKLIILNAVPDKCNLTWSVKDKVLLYADQQTAPLAVYDLETGSIISYNLLTFPNNSESAGAFLVELQSAITANSMSTDGRYIVWESTNDTSHLYAYDLATQSVFSLYLGGDVGSGVESSRPILANGVLFWEQTTGSEGNEVTTIQSRPFDSTLPTTMRPTPTDTTGIFYYKESGHTLVDPFKSFWEKNGGLSIFGFPFTEQMGERSRETNELFLVQYFERQRFEYHPEFRGTPYEVLLGRLGSAEADQRGLSGKGAFLPVDNNKQTGCKYFGVVQHNACGKFYNYWRAYGLDLGDPRISERESLALFGYPISEVFTDPVTGYQTQYFERARFELHPENAGTPYEVLLGRLAINSLVERGWLKV